MNKKKDILFVMNNLNVGGAEKALVSLLQVFDYTKYNVDLLLFKKEGLFLKQVPEQVNILQEPENWKYFDMPFTQVLKENFSPFRWDIVLQRLRYNIATRRAKNTAEAEQYGWKEMAKTIRPLKKKYHCAVGFLEKNPSYFVVDKVNANMKIGFIHNDYNALKLDKGLDKPYFGKMNAVATVSEHCVNILKNEFPEYSDIFRYVPNIVSASLVNSMSKEKIVTLKNALVSVGRLETQKGFDIAVEAAKILKSNGVNFHWYILGEGSERKKLEVLIDKYALTSYFSLLGLMENPYPYIKQAEIFIQPSRFEGKSIAVDEAKILAKPILLTNFTTAKDQIENGVNGMIVDMTPQGVAEGIMKYLNDKEYTEKITSSLRLQEWGTEVEVLKFYKLIER